MNETKAKRPTAMAKAISKSKYLSGLQCDKLLWHHFRAPDLIPPPDESLRAVFDQGHAVGDLAKRLHPGGLEIHLAEGFEQTLTRTRELLPERVPLFEASFRFEGCYCRTDILVPVRDGAWDLIEVKSSTTNGLRCILLGWQHYSFEIDDLAITAGRRFLASE